MNTFLNRHSWCLNKKGGEMRSYKVQYVGHFMFFWHKFPLEMPNRWWFSLARAPSVWILGRQNFWIRKGPTKKHRENVVLKRSIPLNRKFSKEQTSPQQKTANQKFSGRSKCFEEIHPHEFFFQQPSNAATQRRVFFPWLETIRTIGRTSPPDDHPTSWVGGWIVKSPSWTPESAEISVRLGFLNCWYDWNASIMNWTFLSKIEWTTSFSYQIHPRDQTKLSKGSKLLGVLPQDLLQRSAGLCQNIECSSKLAHIMKQHSQIAVRVFWSHWHYSCIKLDRYWLNWGSFGKGMVQKFWFAYFCGYLRTFAGTLRTFCGVVLPHVFWFGTVLDPTKHQTSPNRYVFGGQAWTDIAFLFQHLNH